MAQTILESVINQGLSKHHIHKPYHYRHDLESFVYVLVYAVVNKEHRLLERQDKVDAHVAQDLRKARLSDTIAHDDDIAAADVPRGPNGDPLPTPLEWATDLRSRVFGCSSYYDISEQRSHLSTSWDDFMFGTKRHLDPNYLEHPTRLHWMLVNFLSEAAWQNIAPQSRRLGEAKKSSWLRNKQAHWLNGRQMLELLERELKLQEEGIAPWGDDDDEEEAEAEE
jgi:hypothetical protein